jgi:hypothetical protein
MHRASRPHRTLTAFLAVLVLMWSQWALAAFVCPGLGHAAGTAAGASPSSLAMAERMAAGEPCDGMAAGGDNVPSALCQPHCADAPQSADTPPTPGPTLPALVQAWPAPLQPAQEALGTGMPAQCADEATPRGPPKPLFLATLRLRV